MVSKEVRSFKEDWGVSYFVAYKNDAMYYTICNREFSSVKVLNSKMHYKMKHNTFLRYDWLN